MKERYLIPNPSTLKGHRDPTKRRRELRDTEYSWVSESTKKYAKGLRQRETGVEKIFWQVVRGRKFMGLKFRRQHPIDRYIVDFFCKEFELVIELDGEIHQSQVFYDKQRDIDIELMGKKVLRFPNYMISNHLDIVLYSIACYIH